MLFAADTSALVALSSIRRLDLLRRLASKVWLPPAVVKELITNGEGWRDALQAQEEFVKGEWLLAWTTEFTRLVPTSKKIGQGELEAVSLAHEFKSSCFIDDRRGRTFAALYGVPVIGALGVLCRSKRDGVLDAVNPSLIAMQQRGLIYDPILVNQVLTTMNE